MARHFVRGSLSMRGLSLWLVLAAVWLALLPSARALDDEITDYVTIPAGSYIVDMGVTPQTVANGLKPYGMVYDLVVNYRVPVEWSINPAKAKDGIDFTYNAKNYRGGTFIIRAENVTTTASNVIQSWKAQGVQVDGPISSSIANVPVYDVVNSLARMALDTQNGSIAEKYLIAAGIPASAYSFKLPGALDTCDDLFVLPHADPTWATHGNLVNFTQVGGYLWSACHAVSVLENIDDPGDPDLAPNLNFLSVTGLVLYGSHNKGSPPYTYVSSLDGGPIAQFMGILDSATQSGSEQIYLPKAGGWRPTTKVYVFDPTQADVPGLSPGEAAAVVYGRAFGNNNYGRVMYEGGHSHDGNSAPNVAAQRSFLNFYFLAGIDRRPEPVPNVPAIIVEQQPTNITMTVSGGSGIYTYAWVSSIGGTFSDPTAASTSFTPPDVATNTTAILTATVTDSCGRRTFRSTTYTVQFIPTADLSVTTIASPDPAATSGSLDYTLSVVNNGPQTATNAVVTNTLPAGVTFVSASGSGWACGLIGAGVRCTRATLAPNAGSPSVITLMVTTPGTTGLLTNRAVVYSDLFDANRTNNTNVLTTFLLNGIDLALTKTAPTNGYAGVVLPYTLTVTNHTPVGATNVLINDILPATLNYASASGVNWSAYYDAPTRRVTLLLPALAANGSSTVTLNLIPGTNAAGLTVTNMATVSSVTVDPNPGNSRATNTSAIAAAADLEISKSGEYSGTSTPDAYIFTLELVNNGASVATSITVTDKLTYSTSPFPLFFSNAVATVGSYTSAGVRGSNGGAWTITSLAPGATATLTLYYGGTSSATFTNTAQILSAAQYDPVPANNSATAILDKNFTLLDFGILKTDSPDPVRTGSNITYSITVTNNDPGVDWNGGGKTLTVTDVIPPGTTFVSATGVGWTTGYDGPSRTVTATYTSDIGKKQARTFTLVVTAPTVPGVLTNTANMSYVSPAYTDANPANDSYSQQTTVSGNVDLRLTKSVNDPTPGLGSNVVFTVTVQNLTTNVADATNVRITETIPTGLTYLSAFATLGVFDDSAGYWYVGTLLGGASATLTLTVNAAQAGRITNFVVVSGLTQNDTNSANDGASSVVVVQACDLAVGKTVGNPIPNVGSNVTFTVSLTNFGPNTASNITVSDVLPAGLQYFSHSAGTGSYNSGSGAWTITSLASNANTTLTLTATVTQAGGLTNTAQVLSSSPNDSNPTNNTARAGVTGQQVDLVLGKTVNNDRPLGLGSNLVFTIAVTNLGPSTASNVVLLDLLPASLGFVSASPSQGGYVAGTGLWTVGTLTNSGFATLALTATNRSFGLITNAARFSSATQPESNTLNNAASVLIYSGGEADLYLTKSVDNDEPYQGGVVVYTLTLENSGPDPASGVIIRDVLPAGLRYLSNSAPAGTTFTTNTGDWTVGTLTNGQTMQLTISVLVTGLGSIDNTATIFASNAADPGTIGNSATASLIASAGADLIVLKSGPTNIFAGSNLTYTLTLTNAGFSSATNAILTDTLPPGATFVSASGGGTHSAGVVTWPTLATFTNTATTNVTVTITAPASGTLTNFAAATSATPDAMPANNNGSAATSRVVTTVGASADVATFKSGSTNVVAGSNLTYTITVTNLGPSVASNVVVLDILPTNTVFISATGGGSFSNGVVTWSSLTNFAASTGTNFAVTLTAPASGLITNTAASTSTTGDPAPGNNNGSAAGAKVVTLVVDQADLVIVATGPASVVGGTTLMYSIAVTNTGPSTAINVAVSNNLPGSVTFVSASGGGTTNAGVVGWPTIASLASGATTNFTVTVIAPASGTLSNFATVSGDAFDGNAANNSSSVLTAVTPYAAVITDMYALRGTPDNNIYRITIDASGDSLVYSNYPGGSSATLAMRSIDGMLFYVLNAANGAVYRWDPSTPATAPVSIGTIGVGIPASLRLAFAPDGRLFYMAGDNLYTIDQTTGAATLTYTITGTGGGGDMAFAPDGTMYFANNSTLYRFGSPLANGAATLVGAFSGLSDVSENVVGIAWDTVNARMMLLTASATSSGYYVVNTNDASCLRTGNATGRSATGDLASAPGLATLADVYLAKNGPTNVVAGSNLTYTITVTNLGPAFAVNVVVLDVLPTNSVFVSASSGGILTNGVVRWSSLTNFTPNTGTNFTVTITAPVDGSITNIASSTASTADPNAANNNGTAAGAQVISVVSPSANIVTTKAGSTNVVAGSNLTYTISVTNLGPSTASNVVVSDALPTNTVFVSAPGGSLSNGVVTWSSLTNLAAGTGTNFTITVTAPAAGSITNTASSTAATPDPDPGNNNGSAAGGRVVTVVSASADLFVLKSGLTNALVATNLTYTIAVTNLGPSDATNVVVSDPLPVGASFVSATGGGILASNVVSWAVAALPFGLGTNFTLTVMTPSNAATLTNIVSAASPVPDPAPANNDGSAAASRVLTAVGASADLTLAKSGPTFVIATSNTVYTITLTNLGPSTASNVIVSDTLPGGVTFVSASGGGTLSSNVVTWPALVSLTAGAVSNFTVTVTAPASSGTITNIASLTSATPDPNAANNDGSAAGSRVVTTVNADADLFVAKTGPGNIAATSNLTYTISVTNLGPGTASNVVVSDVLPAGAAFVSADSGGTVSNNIVTWPVIPLLPAGTATNYSVTLTAPPMPGSLTNVASASSSTSDPDASNNDGSASASRVITAVGAAGASISGFVYFDSNHNGFKDGAEAGTGLGGLFAKIFPSSTPAGPALVAVPVDPASGSYVFSNILGGVYHIVIDTGATLSDVTPNLPPGWSGIEMPSQFRTNVALTAVNLPNQNFGLVNALTLTGRVFRDTGLPSGTANDGALNGSEAGLAGVTVKLTDATGSTIHDTATTDGAGNYALLIPNTLSNGVTLKVVETNPNGFLSSGASIGTTGGSYARTNDTVTFTYTGGAVPTGVNFGDVPASTFAPDGQQSGLPGTFVLHPHTFVAGSGGQVTFSVGSAPSPNIPGWNQVIYRDANCNAALDPGELPVTAAITVVAGEQVCLLVKDFIPVTAPLNAQNQITLTAAFAYTGASPALGASLVRTDVTTVGNPTTAGLTLLKTVDKATALPGEIITYTITYANNSAEPLASVIIYDATPAFTTFLSATNGVLPADFTAVAISAPGTGGNGAVKWTFDGTLGPGRTGKVEYKVNVAQ